MLAIMGTSTCHVMNGDELADVPGICGVVDGGIIAGKFGYEAGQSAVGDIFAWWTGLGVPAGYLEEAAERGQNLHEYLSSRCEGQPVGAHGLIALDWMGGNRSILVDHHLSGVIVGLTLATTPEDVYLALLEATAFGTRVIVEAFDAAGRPGHRVHRRRRAQAQPAADADLRGRAAPAGLRRQLGPGARRSGRRSTPRSPRACTPTWPPRRPSMGRSERAAYLPDPARADAYDELFAEYRTLHDYFSGRPEWAGNDVLHRLRDRRNEVTGA